MTEFVKDGYRVSRMDVGTPRDEQERAGLILARAQQWIMRIRDQYLLVDGRAPSPYRDFRLAAFDTMMRVVDTAHLWMSATRGMLDEMGLLFDGVPEGDYMALREKLYSICRSASALALNAPSPAESDRFFAEEIGRLPDDLDRHQQNYEKVGYHEDISVRHGGVGVDDGSPTYHADDHVIPSGGGTVDPETLQPKHTAPDESRRSEPEPPRPFQPEPEWNGLQTDSEQQEKPQQPEYKIGFAVVSKTWAKWQMGVKIHELKTWPVYFEAMRAGYKTFEYRLNDRDFQPGDILALREYTPTQPDGNSTESYTGRTMRVRVTYIVLECPGLPPGYCIMQVAVMP